MFTHSIFDPRAEKCVFIGYAPNKKGYKFYNPQTRKTYVSMDISFVEDRPYFSRNYLQGERAREETDFWNTFTPLPNIISESTILPSETTSQEKLVQDHGNKRNPILSSPSINNEHTEGEIL